MRMLSDLARSPAGAADATRTLACRDRTMIHSGAAVTAGGAGLEPAIEVVLRNGRVLRFPAGVSPARAGALADLLERS